MPEVRMMHSPDFWLWPDVPSAQMTEHQVNDPWVMLFHPRFQWEVGPAPILSAVPAGFCLIIGLGMTDDPLPQPTMATSTDYFFCFCLSQIQPRDGSELDPIVLASTRTTSRFWRGRVKNTSRADPREAVKDTCAGQYRSFLIDLLSLAITVSSDRNSQQLIAALLRPILLDHSRQSIAALLRLILLDRCCASLSGQLPDWAQTGLKHTWTTVQFVFAMSVVVSSPSESEYQGSDCSSNTQGYRGSCFKQCRCGH
ncbi:hypothetical protein PGT21_028982 [Puccinia graminis f. sp. tritici]|uniref:Uncharacterized protein n=1 Tax=Puccinia graminis f. sp. tritici TaxID=56615 RepID=A0A5B0PHX7_PUCGR|nr:hypothetical protein PGT21_028982 [Puccinia graminis f. sp. tritici]